MSGFPLLLIPLAVYNVLAFLMPGLSWGQMIYALSLPSGLSLHLSLGDLFLCGSLVLLFFEILKASGSVSRSIVDHLLATVLFIVGLLEFLLVLQAATTTFLVFLMILLVDMIGGWSISLKSVSRDVAINQES